MRAILTYEYTNTKGVCGNTVGADGSGDFCIIYNGDEENIHQAAKKLLIDLNKSGRLGNWFLIYDQQTFSGKTVREVDV